MPFVCLYMSVCTCVWRASKWLEGFYSYSVFKKLAAINQCLVNTGMNVPAPRAGALHKGLHIEIAIFSKTAVTA
jgi:hypothetical protein